MAALQRSRGKTSATKRSGLVCNGAGSQLPHPACTVPMHPRVSTMRGLLYRRVVHSHSHIATVHQCRDPLSKSRYTVFHFGNAFALSALLQPYSLLARHHCVCALQHNRLAFVR